MKKQAQMKKELKRKKTKLLVRVRKSEMSPLNTNQFIFDPFELVDRKLNKYLSYGSIVGKFGIEIR